MNDVVAGVVEPDKRDTPGENSVSTDSLPSEGLVEAVLGTFGDLAADTAWVRRISLPMDKLPEEAFQPEVRDTLMVALPELEAEAPESVVVGHMADFQKERCSPSMTIRKLIVPVRWVELGKEIGERWVFDHKRRTEQAAVVVALA